MHFQLTPVLFRFFPKCRSKDEIIKKHPHIQKNKPWPQIFFTHFLHRLIKHKSLNEEAKTKCNQHPFPVEKNNGCCKKRIVNKLGSKI